MPGRQEQTDLFFVTLNKSDEDYSPTTRYQDYPISPTLFHWEPEDGRQRSQLGQRYVHQSGVVRDSLSSCAKSTTTNVARATRSSVWEGATRESSVRATDANRVGPRTTDAAEIYHLSKVAAG